MIHFSTNFVLHLLTCCCQFSYTSVVLETTILLPPPSAFFHNISTSLSSHSQDFHHNAGPVPETEDVGTVVSNLSKVHSLKAAIFHTMAYKLSLEIIKNKITPKTFIAFLNVLYNISQIKKKKITFEQYSRINLAGPKIAICETTPNVVFVLNSSFTSKDQYFRAAIQESMTAFNNILQDFGYTQTFEYYDSNTHQAHPPPPNPSIIHQYFHSPSLTLQVHLFLTSSSSFDAAWGCSC